MRFMHKYEKPANETQNPLKPLEAFKNKTLLGILFATLAIHGIIVSANANKKYVTIDETNESVRAHENLLLEIVELAKYPEAPVPNKGSDIAIMRNPFSTPINSLETQIQMLPPGIGIKGFSLSGQSAKVFLSVDGSEDYAYTVGQEIGNGYRLTAISPQESKIVLSDGFTSKIYKVAN